MQKIHSLGEIASIGETADRSLYTKNGNKEAFAPRVAPRSAKQPTEVFAPRH
jgi:hypothetical protein